MNKDKNIITTIRDNYDDLSRSFKIVADYVLNNTREVSLYNNMRSLAENSGVSQSSIIRFAKHLNLKGTKELQRKLKEIDQASFTTKQDLLNIVEKVAESDEHSKERDKFTKYLLENHEDIEDLATITKKLNISRGVIYNFIKRYFNISSFEKFKTVMSGKENPLSSTKKDTFKKLGVEFKPPQKSNWDLSEIFSIMKKANNILIYDPFEEIEFLMSDQLRDLGFLNQYEIDYRKINNQLDYFINQRENIKNNLTNILTEYFRVELKVSEESLKKTLDYQDLLVVYANHDRRNQKDFEEIDELIQKAKANGFKVMLFEGGNKLLNISFAEIDKNIVINNLVPKMSYHNESPMELQAFHNAFYFTVMIKTFMQENRMVS